jgi:hypothetical protein
MSSSEYPAVSVENIPLSPRSEGERKGAIWKLKDGTRRDLRSPSTEDLFRPEAGIVVSRGFSSTGFLESEDGKDPSDQDVIVPGFGSKPPTSGNIRRPIAEKKTIVGKPIV